MGFDGYDPFVSMRQPYIVKIRDEGEKRDHGEREWRNYANQYFTVLYFFREERFLDFF